MLKSPKRTHNVNPADRYASADSFVILDRQSAIAALKKDNELYAWPAAYESDDAFAFVMLYKGKAEEWWVALHHKVVDYENIKYYTEIDALSFKSEEQKTSFPTPQDAIAFAVSEYKISEFMDYKTITNKYKNRYSNNV